VITMPKKLTKEKIVERYFTWRLGKRGGVYYADGRSNTPPAGRHSLETKDYQKARAALRQLDLALAVEAGRADPGELDPQGPEPLGLEDGWELYRRHVSRPRVRGGAKPKSVQRYKAVFDKFVPYAQGEGVTAWDRVTTQLLDGYAAWLDGEGYAYRTEYLELTTLKQAINWLHSAAHLRAGPRIDLPLVKPEGSDTYCWTQAEVDAILAYCRARPPLHWLADVVVALACTGLRISELASLRWSDIDWAANVIRLTDESTQAQREGGGPRRETKSSRGRSFPIHPDLRAVLERMRPAAGGAVFHGPRLGALKPDTVRGVLVREVLAPLAGRFPPPPAGKGFRDGRLHSFRHYFCSRCANDGTPELAVMSWLGHRQSEMVKYYYHLHDAEAQRQMQQVRFFGNTGGDGAAV
jgi:integrase